MRDTTAYAAATLAYGIQVDALDLIYTARAWFRHQRELRFLQLCAARRHRSGTSKDRNGTDAAHIGTTVLSPDSRPRTGPPTILTLPTETLKNIERWLCRIGADEAVCESWLLFDEEGVAKFHPQFCCSRVPDAEWPSRVEQAWRSARDAFREHFSFVVPRCQAPCQGNHVCQLVHAFLDNWGLCLADCPIEDDIPTNWLVTPSTSPSKTIPRTSTSSSSRDPADRTTSSHALNGRGLEAQNLATSTASSSLNLSSTTTSPPSATHSRLRSDPDSSPSHGSSSSSVKGKPRFSHHISLDTDDLSDELVRTSIVIRPDWQAGQLRNQDRFRRFLSESGVERATGSLPRPAFHLVCMAQHESPSS